MTRFQGEPILGKEVRGIACASSVPLSFWGGLDPETGIIIDQRHPLVGQCISGHVLVIPTGRGSCSGSGVLLEAIVNGAAPAAILISRIDPIIALGCVLGDELYDSHPALIVIGDMDREHIRTGDEIAVSDDGWVQLSRHEPAVRQSE